LPALIVALSDLDRIFEPTNNWSHLRLSVVSFWRGVRGEGWRRSLVIVSNSWRLLGIGLIMAGMAIGAALPPAPGPSPRNGAAEVHHAMDGLLTEPDAVAWAWVFLRDKGFADASSRRAASEKLIYDYDPRAIDRRQARRTRPGLFDATDLPVREAYVEALEATGGTVRARSRWLNAVSIQLNRRQLEHVAHLPFVASIEPVRRGRLIDPVDKPMTTPLKVSASAGVSFYGNSEAQILQINLAALHDAGFTGAGVVVGILDTGFKRTHDAFNDVMHPLDVVMEWDFINSDGNTANEAGDLSIQHNHGTWILGAIGAYLPGQLVGAAYDASFILCKTEDTMQEDIVEEDWFVEGLEFIEANGGDLFTSSLGYIDWYTQDDLDGLTAITTRAVNIANANGVFGCTAAGNYYHDSDPTTSSLIAPADALGVITCGAADSTGVIASFSSDGPTAALVPQDRRVKPELLARGVSTQTVNISNDSTFSGVGGTSLSTPLVAGAVACLIQAHPTWTLSEMRHYLFQTADDFVANGQADPMFVRGFGMVNAYRAARAPCPADGDFSGDVGIGDFLNVLADWGPCGDPLLACPGDNDFDGEVGIADFLATLAAWGACP
jgi:subtilisin family serine protease